jgi:hypothetical protein
MELLLYVLLIGLLFLIYSAVLSVNQSIKVLIKQNEEQVKIKNTNVTN